jgi:hypothetical protein
MNAELLILGLFSSATGLIALLSKADINCLSRAPIIDAESLPAADSPFAHLVRTRVVLSGTIADVQDNAIKMTARASPAIDDYRHPTPLLLDNSSSPSESPSSSLVGTSWNPSAISSSIGWGRIWPSSSTATTAATATTATTAAATPANREVIVMVDGQVAVSLSDLKDAPLADSSGSHTVLINPNGWSVSSRLTSFLLDDTPAVKTPASLTEYLSQQASVYGEVVAVPFVDGWRWVFRPESTLFISRIGDTISDTRTRLLEARLPLFYFSAALSLFSGAWAVASAYYAERPLRSEKPTECIHANHHIVYVVQERDEYWLFDLEYVTHTHTHSLTHTLSLSLSVCLSVCLIVLSLAHWIRVEKTAPNQPFQPDGQRCYISVAEATQYLLSSRLVTPDMICVSSQEVGRVSVRLRVCITAACQLSGNYCATHTRL